MPSTSRELRFSPLRSSLRARPLCEAYGRAPSSSHFVKVATCSAGHGPSQGIDPLPNRAAMASPFAATSVADHRSNALLMAARSLSRKSGLMSRSKLRSGISSHPSEIGLLVGQNPRETTDRCLVMGSVGVPSWAFTPTPPATAQLEIGDLTAPPAVVHAQHRTRFTNNQDSRRRARLAASNGMDLGHHRCRPVESGFVPRLSWANDRVIDPQVGQLGQVVEDGDATSRWVNKGRHRLLDGVIVPTGIRTVRSKDFELVLEVVSETGAGQIEQVAHVGIAGDEPQGLPFPAAGDEDRGVGVLQG